MTPNCVLNFGTTLMNSITSHRLHTAELPYYHLIYDNNYSWKLWPFYVLNSLSSVEFIVATKCAGNTQEMYPSLNSWWLKLYTVFFIANTNVSLQTNFWFWFSLCSLFLIIWKPAFIQDIFFFSYFKMTFSCETADSQGPNHQNILAL